MRFAVTGRWELAVRNQEVRTGDAVADRVVWWNKILLPIFGLAAGIGGAASGLSKAVTIWLILGGCALVLGCEYLWLRARGGDDA